MEKKRAKQILISIRNADDWISKVEDCEEKKEALRCIENAEGELHKSIRDLQGKNEN